MIDYRTNLRRYIVDFNGYPTLDIDRMVEDGILPDEVYECATNREMFEKYLKRCAEHNGLSYVFSEAPLATILDDNSYTLADFITSDSKGNRNFMVDESVLKGNKDYKKYVMKPYDFVFYINKSLLEPDMVFDDYATIISKYSKTPGMIYRKNEKYDMYEDDSNYPKPCDYDMWFFM